MAVSDSRIVMSTRVCSCVEFRNGDLCLFVANQG